MKKANRATPKIMHRAGELRQEPTPAEAKLWTYLRAHRFTDDHFRRQHAIGPYIADFSAPSRKLVIELDGSQHLDQEESDAERTAFLASKGYRVLRFWNSDVMNKTMDVMAMILEELKKPGSDKKID
jgi:very-short-patch-repair endonuclease